MSQPIPDLMSPALQTGGDTGTSAKKPALHVDSMLSTLVGQGKATNIQLMIRPDTCRLRGQGLSEKSVGDVQTEGRFERLVALVCWQAGDHPTTSTTSTAYPKSSCDSSR